MNDFSKNPSDIAEAAAAFISEVKVANKTKEIYTRVLWLFIESLKDDPSAVAETRDGEYVLTANWNAYYGGVIQSFIDYWIPRKVMASAQIVDKAPAVMRKFVTWSYENNYFDKARFDEFRAALPRSKAKESTRLRKLGDALYRLHSPVAGTSFKSGSSIVRSINESRRPDEVEEGYFKLQSLDGAAGYFLISSKTIGPVVLSDEVISLIEVEDVVNLAIGRFGAKWYVLESGNAYLASVAF